MINIELSSRLDSSAMDNTGVSSAAAMDFDSYAFDDAKDPATGLDSSE